MKVLITTLAPLSAGLSQAPRPLRAIPDFLTAGHEVYVAAPLWESAEVIRQEWGIEALLPLYAMPSKAWLRVLLNGWRVVYWAQQWQPDIYLSVGAQCAMMAHSARGATGGYGLAVLLLPELRFESDGHFARWIERRTIHECDRLVTYDAEFADHLITNCGARGGDLALLEGSDSAELVALCEAYLAEPPGFT